MLPKELPLHRLLPRPLLHPELAHTTVGVAEVHLGL